MKALSTASLWTLRQSCILGNWVKGWMCGCVWFHSTKPFTPKPHLRPPTPGPQAEDAERDAPGAGLTYSFTGSCYSFIRKRSMWERREEWAWGKLALQIYVLLQKTSYSQSAKNKRIQINMHIYMNNKGLLILTCNKFIFKILIPTSLDLLHTNLYWLYNEFFMFK